ncbi:MAG: UDP-N-acetylmuramate--L-alanine ligase, partial [Eubacterium sp.]|nr:UDP-N-acetylmuramate--L-alanine ligase [Candidatus Colimonas fimequi]
EFNAEGMPAFDVSHGGEVLCRIQLSVPGEHNILNALASFACCHIMGVSPAEISKTLVEYAGTQRRFDLLGKTSNGVKIYDDYAHHPTEIKATLAAVKNMQHNTLWCLFQPHTYTRTMALMDEFAESFTVADKVVLAEIYAAREKNIHKISSTQLMDKIKANEPDKDICYFPDFDEIAAYVYENAQEGDLILTMGAGDIYRVGEKILALDAEK